MVFTCVLRQGIDGTSFGAFLVMVYTDDLEGGMTRSEYSSNFLLKIFKQYDNK